jgi:MYXO-CTERM domain-containing protein
VLIPRLTGVERLNGKIPKLLYDGLARRLQRVQLADCECVMMKRFWLILTIFLGLASTAVPASADIVWTLNQGSLGPAGTVYGTVTAVQKGAGAGQFVEVTITLASTATTKNYLLATGTHTGIDWDMSIVPNAVTVVNSVNPHSDSSKFDVQALNGSYDDQPFTSGGNGNFNYAITPKANSGGKATETSIVFDLTKTGGLVLTNSLFTANAGGYYWAVDIGYACTTGSNGKADCGSRTGVIAANSYVVTTPEPGTWTMSIAGLAGLTGLMALRRRRKLVRA